MALCFSREIFILKISKFENLWSGVHCRKEKEEESIAGSLYPLIQFLILTEAERKKFLDQFLYAEQEFVAAKGREQALQEQLLKEVNDYQERFRKQIQSQSDLEVCLSLFLM